MTEKNQIHDDAQGTSELAARLRASADHDGPQELKMVMRRVATALDRTQSPAIPRTPKVRTSHHRNAEEAARLQALVDKRFAPDVLQPPAAPVDNGSMHGEYTPVTVRASTTPHQSFSADTAVVRSFDTTGTTFRRVGQVLTITCDSGEIANKVSDQLRTPVDQTNHHNALKCPYCNPKGLQFADVPQPVKQFCTHPDYSDWDGTGPEPRPSEEQRRLRRLADGQKRPAQNSPDGYPEDSPALSRPQSEG